MPMGEDGWVGGCADAQGCRWAGLRMRKGLSRWAEDGPMGRWVADGQGYRWVRMGGWVGVRMRTDADGRGCGCAKD